LLPYIWIKPRFRFILRRLVHNEVTMNPNIQRLHSYPFEKLAKLKANVTENSALEHISLSIGEPKHTPPQFVLDELTKHLSTIAQYPLTKGTDALRESIAQWLSKRFHLQNTRIDAAKHVIPVNGTREALFAFAQAVIDPIERPLILSPNPFYQIYEGAAILSGAEIGFLNTTLENNFTPDLDDVSDETWKRCQLIYICTPGNPTGKVFSEAYLEKLIHLADKYDFIVASDECYSEIYPDENNPPPGLLEVAAKMGRDNFERCVVFHSLSKRSNLPGLRSGFVAGDAKILASFLKYRTYHGCAMPVPTQMASIAAWNDEIHVKNNRAMYRSKFESVLKILKPVMDVDQPDASFYLWPKTPINDEAFAQKLFAEQNITVLPGSYLSRVSDGVNAGENHIRIALVAEIENCIEAAKRIKHFIENLSN